MKAVDAIDRSPVAGRLLRLGPKGPVSRRRVGRTLLTAGLVLAASGLLSATAASPPFLAFAFGLAFPGGGFAICGASGPTIDMTALLISGGAMATFALAMFLWFATGNLIGPPAVWMASASGASGYAIHHGCVAAGDGLPSALGFALATGFIAAGSSLFRAVPASTHGETAAKTPRPVILPALPGALSLPDELGNDDLARIRFLLDRALQPLERFDGFEKLDQFQSAALRYQLQFAGFALAIVQRNNLPALRGYLTEAQANLIEKARLHRVWRYWAAERLWGSGRLDPNPFAADNVMYTGFCATQIALFQAASGDRRFSRPGAFSLVHPSGRTFEADFPSLIGNLVGQHAGSAFGLIACEPNWLFPVCNGIGYVAIAAHDAQFGSAVWQDMALRQQTSMVEEFRDARGRFITCRSSLTGLAMPAIGGALTQLLPSFFLNATLPDLAHANWTRLRGDLLERTGAGTRARLRSFWPIDVGNYRFTRIAGLCGAAATAVELGDSEVAAAMLEALESRYPMRTFGGQGHRDDASIWAHAFEVMARSGRPDGLRDLVRYPSTRQAAEPLPHVATCPYPVALVARAVVSERHLDVTLVPGSRAGRISLGLAGLRPSTTYRRSDGGSAFASAADGTASIDVQLDARRRIVIGEAV